MNKEEIIHQIENQKKVPHLKFRLKTSTENFTNKLFHTLFDAEIPVEKNLEELEKDFETLVDLACWDLEKPCIKLWDNYVAKLPELLYKLNKDAEAIFTNDPASNSIEEVYLSYPGFFAVAIYRFAHEFHEAGFPLVPRMMTEYAHRLTGVDIHPGATIGTSFFIDHATGIVIGETAIIKNNVKIYQGVTLGALYVEKNLKNVKRHPTVENNVTIYANATILGGNTIVGKNSIIGGNVWITSSIPENSLVTHSPEIKIRQNYE
ncbi:serine O-acetyltransferase EpsC [Mesonia sp. K4-1]|jgi:serine O-acetyltransferase|uniref:serine O-acetyltransferase EpsC n=1 Tax=Mesonia sp. K4-1 TaxID=2602760 RepID=UPI0011C9C931|nr:serine O-acetyltransferase EpsC [Mesonia sp. K4-1]TXK79389.1 serine acetyltransferase [Mesonia sp. K4-1]